ncbi:unnamed protein product [marine sediment metagenome]|uniref:Uncharacterized protein n=1 Tax=marine sediment metagenome TaxID=412755 RepID=X1VKK5_9ZZZZ
MYRYIQSPQFTKGLNGYKKVIDDKSLNNFLKDLSNAPRSAKSAHYLQGAFAKFNIWSAHFKTRGSVFFTTLYLLCDDKLSSCSGSQKLCNTFIQKCEKPTQQIVFLEIAKDEPYKKLADFYT